MHALRRLPRPRLGVALVMGGLALGAYVAWPCATWARAPAPGAAARLALAAHLAARCDALGSIVAAPALTCWVATEAERLPAVPRACAGRAHHVLRLEAAFVPARPAARSVDTRASLAPLGMVLATLAAAFPEDTSVRTLHAAAQVGPAALRAALGARGYRSLELAEAGAPLRTFALPVAAAGAPVRAHPPTGPR